MEAGIKKNKGVLERSYFYLFHVNLYKQQYFKTHISTPQSLNFAIY